jgi:hypothetical protein
MNDVNLSLDQNANANLEERKRRALPPQLSTSRIKRVFAQGTVKDWADFWARYTATTRGITPDRIAAVREFQKSGDLTRLMKVLGTKSQATAFKAIGQVQDYLTRHENRTGGLLQRYAREVAAELDGSREAKKAGEMV